MPSAVKFGDSQHYYAISESEERKRPASSLSYLDSSIQQILEQHDPELREKVERTFKQWNLIIRDYLRADTGLRLSVGDEQQAVPVRIVAGLPEPLRKLLKDVPLPALRLFLEKDRLRGGLDAVAILQRDFQLLTERINQSRHGPSTTGETDLAATMSFTRQSLAVLDELQLEKRIGQIEQDTLGAYFFLFPKIELYWMVIGLVARMLNVSVEGLTAVVAIHELAHAYTHLGRDIDRQQWRTEDFAMTDLRIVEGTAQFYTAMVAHKLLPRFPAAWKAYEALLKVQPLPYTIHKEWTEKPEEAGEVIRAAMIECRFKRTREYKDFEAMIDRQLDLIKGRKRKKAPITSAAVRPTV